MAQIACEIRRSYVKRPGRYNIEQFLIKFTTKKPTDPKTAAEKKDHVAKSKAFWLGGMHNLKRVKSK